MFTMNKIVDLSAWFLTWTEEEIKDYFRGWNVEDLQALLKDMEQKQAFEYCAIIRGILIEKT